ncbi:hypothetical protein [Paenibacillus sp. FSL L8-0708]|uniref:hypothetical protein n=1 Tax=Paenibacillus sp. FSL L8-0708 TaxID=2975311 RepID=UPI0030FA6706
MKKKIIGVIAAALLLGSSIGYAASSSLIGAKVTGLFTIQKEDGTKIADAVIINGSAYAPVRAVSEATGASLTVKGKTITMGSKEAVAETGTTVAEPVATLEASVDTAKLKERVTALESRVKLFDDAIAKEDANFYLMETPDQQESAKKFIEDLKARRAEASADLADIKAQLGE